MSQSIFPTLISNTFIPALWTFPSSQITAEYLNSNFLKYPVGQGSQTIPGTLSTNIITPLYTTIPTYTSSMIGYTITQTNALTNQSNGVGIDGTAISLPIGVYMISSKANVGNIAPTFYTLSLVQTAVVVLETTLNPAFSNTTQACSTIFTIPVVVSSASQSYFTRVNVSSPVSAIYSITLTTRAVRIA